MTDVILVVNSGSSSLKFALFPVETETSDPLVKGKVTSIGRQPVLTASINDEAVSVTEPLNNIPNDATHEWLITQLLGEPICDV